MHLLKATYNLRPLACKAARQQLQCIGTGVPPRKHKACKKAQLISSRRTGSDRMVWCRALVLSEIITRKKLSIPTTITTIIEYGEET